MKNKIYIVVLASIFLIGCNPTKTTNACNNGASVLGDSSDFDEAIPFEDAPAISQEQIDKYLKAINEARFHSRYCGSKKFNATTKLEWSNKLYTAAYEHSQDMGKNCSISHSGSGKESDWTAKVHSLNHPSKVDERVKNSGFKNGYIGENVAAGYKNLDEVMKGWLNSPGHCENIMNPNYKYVGMALYYNSRDSKQYHYYWTQNFGGK